MPSKKDDVRYTDYVAVRTAVQLRDLYTRAISLLCFRTHYIRHRVMDLAAEMHGGLTRDRSLFVDRRDKDLEFVQRMLFSATCGNDALLEWFLVTHDFHLLVYDEWIRDFVQYSEEFLRCDAEYAKNPIKNWDKGRRLDELRTLLEAKDGLRGALIEVSRIYRRINDIREQVITDYAALCHSFARMYGKSAPHVDHLSVVQSARMGVLKALLTYNPNRNIRFGVYAKNWITQAVLDHTKKTSKTPIHLPASTWSDYSKIADAEARITAKEGQLDEDELTEKIHQATRIPIVKIIKVRNRITSAHAVSLEEQTKVGGHEDDNHRSLLDLLSSDSPAVDDSLVNQRDIDLSHITPKQRLIVAMRFGYWEKLPKGEPSEADMNLEKVRQHLAGLMIRSRDARRDSQGLLESEGKPRRARWRRR